MILTKSFRTKSFRERKYGMLISTEKKRKKKQTENSENKTIARLDEHIQKPF